MSPDKSRLAEAIANCDMSEVVRAIDEINGTLHALFTTMEEFRTDLIHVLRNPPQEWSIEGRYSSNVLIANSGEVHERIPESITCSGSCDASCDSLADALMEGWTDLVRDEGPSWNFLGVCPACQAAEAEQEFRDRTAEGQSATETKANQETLF